MKNQIGPMERPGLLASSSKVMIQSRQKKAIESISQAASLLHQTPHTTRAAQHNGLFLPEDKDGQWPVRFVRTDAGHGLAPKIVGKSLETKKRIEKKALPILYFIHDWIRNRLRVSQYLDKTLGYLTIIPETCAYFVH